MLTTGLGMEGGCLNSSPVHPSLHDPVPTHPQAQLARRLGAPGAEGAALQVPGRVVALSGHQAGPDAALPACSVQAVGKGGQSAALLPSQPGALPIRPFHPAPGGLLPPRAPGDAGQRVVSAPALRAEERVAGAAGHLALVRQLRRRGVHLLRRRCGRVGVCMVGARQEAAGALTVRRLPVSSPCIRLLPLPP